MIRRASTFSLCGFFAAGPMLCFSGVVFAQTLPQSGIEQIQTILQEKLTRTPAQQKLDSHLHLAGQTARGALHVETMPSLANVGKALEFDAQGRVHVDIQGMVNEALLAEIANLGGSVESSHPKYRAIRGWMPLLNLETLANRPDVTFIEPAAKAIHNSRLAVRARAALGRLPTAQRAENVRRQLESALRISASHEAGGRVIKSSPVTQAIVDTNGVISEGADLVQALGLIGTGVKVGVLSDGVMSLVSLQQMGDLPGVTVLNGQAGPATGDEGTAMLEIVHDLAPGATLFFATAFTGEAQFATNIQNLAAAGCQIIVDDVTYFNEGAFQDGIIAQAVNTVTASGVLYFSSAQNSGNLDSGTSGTWEGDFNGAGGAITVINTAEGKTVTVHAFDSTHNYDAISVASSNGQVTTLKWSDPLGAACNDYDLFIMNSTLSTVLDSSTNRQTCTQDPYEQTLISPAAGDRIVVVLFSGSTRALHVDTERAQLAISTSGATFGHNAAGSALTVAATPAQTTIFTSGNQAPEFYSSDGPRKIFYNPDGSVITPGNFLFGTGGGTTLAKDDFTTADCGQSAVPGFSPFCGTSAAAPTAAAIAALMMSGNSSLTPSQVKSAMKSTALAAKAGFNTRTVGAGIVMANLAVNAVVPTISLSPPSIFFGTQLLATSSGAQVIGLANTGTATVTISGITITGANNGDFSQSNTCGASVAAGANCSISVTFKPTATGNRAASVSFTDNAVGSPQNVPLTGTGVAVALAPTSLTFSRQSVTTSSAPQMVTLTNNGNSSLTITGITIIGTNSSDFSETNICPITPATLAAGSKCTISASFKPTTTGARSANLSVTDNASNSPQAIALAGTGTDFSIGPAMGGSTSATVTAGQTATYNLQVSPVSGFNGAVTFSLCSGTPSGATCTTSLASVFVNGTAASAFTVSVTTTAPSMIVPRTGPLNWPPLTGLRLIFLLLLALALLAILGRSGDAGKLPRLGLALAPALAFVLLTLTWVAGCGGGGNSAPRNFGTPKGTSTFTLTATSGTVTSGVLSHTQKLTLTVN